MGHRLRRPIRDVHWNILHAAIAGKTRLSTGALYITGACRSDGTWQRRPVRALKKRGFIDLSICLCHSDGSDDRCKRATGWRQPERRPTVLREFAEAFLSLSTSLLMIVLFTKNRPDRLEQVLPMLPRSIVDVVLLLDDSCCQACVRENRELAARFDLRYHGPDDQEIFMRSLVPILTPFVGRLGHDEWNLGNNRNYALVYAIAGGASAFVMMDDDVIIRSPEDLRAVFNLLQRRRVVGAEIERMPDDSIVGHVYRSAGEVQPRYASGTFVGINTRGISYFFPNYYNEDWIWLFLEMKGKAVARSIAVEQLIFDPFVNWHEKIFFQEYGEIMWEGVYRSGRGQLKTLTDPDHWDRILEIRHRAIDCIDRLPVPPLQKSLGRDIRRLLLEYLGQMEPRRFATAWLDYKDALPNWRQGLETLRSRNR